MQPLVLAKNTHLMDRKDWLKYRENGIGGSEAAAVAGVSKYKNAVSVWLEKTGQIDPPEDNEYMFWGRILEDPIAKAFQEKTGIKVRKCNQILQHPVHKFMFANVDRLIPGEKAGLEIKTTSAYNSDKWEGEGSDGIPAEYYIQCQHYMTVMDYDRWYIAALIGGNKFVWKVVERDPESIDYLITLEREFWQHVKNGTMPAVDGSEASTNALKALFPSARDKTSVELSQDAHTWIDNYYAAKNIEEQAKAQKEEAANKIKLLMAKNELATFDGEIIATWKNTKTNRLDTDRLKKEQPDIYKEFLKTTEGRRFMVK